MPQSLAEIYLHIVFSTKGRHPFLHDRAIREQVHNYLFGTCKNLDCPPLRVGGVEDHIHIACRLGKSISISNLIKEPKRESSQWIKGLAPDLAGFYWQSGYGAFSISPGHVAELVAYIKQEGRVLGGGTSVGWDKLALSILHLRWTMPRAPADQDGTLVNGGPALANVSVCTGESCSRACPTLQFLINIRQNGVKRRDAPWR